MARLLDALVKSLEHAQGIMGARTAHFAFSNDGLDTAFISEIEAEELVPLLEAWCKKQREETQVH